MKKMKNIIKVSAVCGAMSLLVATTALAASREGLYGGKCIWSGGIENGVVYSQFQDNRNDQYYYSGTVYVRNDRGQQRSKQGKTTGVGSTGRVRVQITATYVKPLEVNRSWYKGIKQCN